MTAGFVLDTAAHAAFAALSGDHSPLHVDPVAARRRYPGEPVAHGMHVLLLALEHAAVMHRLGGAAPRTLRATFVRPVLPGDRCEIDGDGTVLRVLVGGLPAAVIRLEAGAVAEPRPPEAALLAAGPVEPTATAADLRLTDLAGLQGVAPAVPDAEGLAARFPAVATLLGRDVVAELAAVSAVVGMHCPGRRALLADVTIDLSPMGDGRIDPGIAWWAERIAPAASRATIGVRGRRVAGHLGVLVLPDPPDRSCAALVGRVDPDEFAGTTPLVVGGSRGLGATAARLLALGGADVLITWATEPGPAEAVVADIVAAGGRSRAVRLDVTDSPAAVSALERTGWQGDQLHLFASPRILRRHLGSDRPDLRAELRAVHVTGPMDLVVALLARRDERLAVGYPSSVAVDDTPDDMREYAEVKAEAEAALGALVAAHPHLRVVTRRLPRIVTEQTVAFTPAPAGDAVDELLPLLRAVRDAAADR